MGLLTAKETDGSAGTEKLTLTFNGGDKNGLYILSLKGTKALKEGEDKKV